MAVVLEDYQKEAVEKGIDILRRYKIVYLCFWMRKGKTLTSMTIAWNYVEKATNPRVLFITVKAAIPDIQKDYNALAPGYEIVITNYESLHKVTGNFNLVIVDEAHKISKYPKPAVACEKIKKLAAYLPIIYLSATPTPESFSQFYHQFWVSTFSPLAKWHNFYRFADEFVDKVMEEYKGLPVANYDDCDMKKLKPLINHLFVVIGQDDGKKMLHVKHHILYVDMTPKAIEIYQNLKRHKIHIDEKGNAATCNSGAERDSKLLQISSGTLIYNETIDGVIQNRTGTIIDISKAEFIRSYFFGKKIAILFKYTAEGEMLKKFFPDWTEDQMEFNSNNHLTFIKQIKRTKTGVNLSTADAMIVITPDDSAETFIQSSARIQHIHRQEDPNVYYIFSKHGIEPKIYKNAKETKREYTAYHYA